MNEAVVNLKLIDEAKKSDSEEHVKIINNELIHVGANENLMNINPVLDVPKSISKTSLPHSPKGNRLSVKSGNKLEDRSFLIDKKCLRKKKKNASMWKTETNLLYLTNAIKESDANTPEGKFHSKINKVYYVISILAFLHIIFMLADNQLSINYSNKELLKEKFTENMKVETVIARKLQRIISRRLTRSENAFRILNLLISLVMVTCFFLISYEEYVYKNIHSASFSRLSRKGYVKYSLRYKYVEIICSLFFFPPSINPLYIIQQGTVKYPLYLLSVFLIINFLLKSYIIYSSMETVVLWNNTQNSICRNYKIKPTLLFLIKTKFHSHPFTLVTTVLLVMSAIFSLMTRGFEFAAYDSSRSLDDIRRQNLSSISNVLWLFLITSLTSGYGDYYPKTIIGRTFFLICELIVMCLIAYVIKKIINVFEMTVDEKKVYLKLKKLYTKDNTEHKASNIIREILLMKKMHKLRKQNEGKSFLMELFMIYLMLRKDAKKLNDECAIASSFAVSVDDLVKSMEKKMENNVEFLNGHIEKLNGIEEKFEKIKGDQKEIIANLKIVNSYQATLGEYLVKINNRAFKKKQLEKCSLQFNSQNGGEDTPLKSLKPRRNFSSKINPRKKRKSFKQRTFKTSNNNALDSLSPFKNDKNNENK